MNYAGVATNNFSMDELIAVGGPPAKAKAAKPAAKAAAPPKVASAESANKAKAMSKNETANVNKFSVVNLFEEKPPVYRYDNSGAISIDVHENHWNTMLDQAQAGLNELADATLQWPSKIVFDRMKGK